MIKTFQQFNEEISGTELAGAGFGTLMIGGGGDGIGGINKDDTSSDISQDVIFSELDSKIYTIDEYNNLYGDYLKMGGSPLNGFTKENIDIILDFLQTN